MKVFFIGDIIGSPGRMAVRELLPALISRKKIDLVMANCENVAAGFGVTQKVVEELFKCNIDVLTSGNHIWNKKEVLEFIGDFERLLRPANYPSAAPGTGTALIPLKTGEYVGILNLAGRVFMSPSDCPFVTAKNKVAGLREKTNIIVVDMHAEATSEKKALGWYLDGEVSAVIGTHTHVQTADEEILPQGTAYISDAGMTGPFNSVIGINKEAIIERFLTQMPNKFEVAKEDIRMQGVIVDIESPSGKAKSIERVSVKLKDS